MTVNADNPAFEGAAPDPADDELSTTAPNPPDDELSTTAPNPPEDTWKMPEPVFRKTSGRLPQGFGKELENVTKERAAKITGGDPSPPPISAATPSEIKPKNPTLKLVLVILGIAGMIGFIVVFLTVVYFLFLR